MHLSVRMSSLSADAPSPDAGAGCVSVCGMTHSEEEFISLEGVNSSERVVSVEHVQDAVMYLLALSARQMSEVCITVTCFLKTALAIVKNRIASAVRHFSILNRLFICCFRL